MARIRNIKRNTSNQIISYSIPPNSDVEYGVVRLPAVETVYGIDSYKRTLDRLSGDLLQQVDNDGNVFVDTFSGRYTITNGATEVPGGGKSWTGYKDFHYINPHVAPGSVTTYGDHRNNFRYPGYRTIPFDYTEEGPGLKNGGYVITPELIESGKSLKLTAIIGVVNELKDNDGNDLDNSVRYKFKFNRIRKPYEPNSRDDLGNVVDVPVNRGQYPFIKVEFDVLNSEMQVGDIWELQGQVTTGFSGCFLDGSKSLFEVELF